MFRAPRPGLRFHTGGARWIVSQRCSGLPDGRVDENGKGWQTVAVVVMLARCGAEYVVRRVSVAGGGSAIAVALGEVLLVG